MRNEDALVQPHQIADRACATAPFGAGRMCCLCGPQVRRFLPYHGVWFGIPAVLADADVVGSDVANVECPVCGCHDREQHLFLYLQASGLLKSMVGARVLLFATETHPQRGIWRAMRLEYGLGALHPTRPDIQRIDLIQIGRPDSSLDFVIANHVLEHARDDSRSLREMYRVLRPGGHAILQTPFASLRGHKFEDPGITSDARRSQAYGQENHCRLYGADFADFVTSIGFVGKTATHEQLLPHVGARCMGVNSQEPFMLFGKRGN